MDASDPLPVGDRLWVVLLAYFLVFLPWSVVQAIDFISSDWKSVNDTRRDGWVQFAITLIPVFAISFYIYFQARAGDYKEMAAAIVALCFALTHLATTWWGLCQLDEFRRWATAAVRVLESHGTPYTILRDYEPPPPRTSNIAEWKAGQIKVNESIVDNSIYTGKTVCYAVRGDGGEWMQLGARQKRRWYSKLVIVAQTLVVVVGSWLFNVLHFAARACKLRRKHAEHSLWRLRPYEPVDVWINWAVAFAAQGLDDWIEQFDAVAPPAPADGRTARGYQDRQSYFAREVLTSAVLLLPDRHFLVDEGEVRFGEGHPLRWGGDDVADTAFGRMGKVDKMDMLQHAVLSGRNLPFNAPHATKEPSGNSTIDAVSADLKKSGYQSYDYDLKEAVGDMPSKFGNAIDKFTVNMLEWLTIMLSTGVWEEKPKRKRRRKVEDPQTGSSNEIGNGESSPSDSSLDENDFLLNSAALSESNLGSLANMEGSTDSDLVEGSSPIVALRSQLGIVDDGRPLVCEGRKGFAALPLPLKQTGIGDVLWGNRAVLQVSAAIDNWVALHAGDCLNKVLKCDPDWRQACLAIRDGNDIDSIEESDLSRRRSDVMKELAGESYLVYANDILERFRFTAQFGMGEVTDHHLDQTITFVGVVMESVRSALAAGLPTGGRIADTKYWMPPITFTEGSGLLTSPLKFELSESVTCGLRSCEVNNSSDAQESAMTRPLEMRLLWELQNECRNDVEEQILRPGDITAMIGCILGFPALCFRSRVSHVRPVRTSRLHRSATSVTFIEREWDASVRPVCAPQELYVTFSIELRSGAKTADVYVRLARSSTERDDSFDWQSWRDAFNGRLRGLRKWQERQGVHVLEECVTYSGIVQGIERWKLPDPRTGSQLRVWAGWLPHRPSICKYEVGSEGIIRQYAMSGLGFEQEGKPISYGSACQEDLAYTLGAVAERLFEIRQKELPSDAGGTAIGSLPTVIRPADQLVRQGKELLQRKKPDLHGALQCFDLAARNDNVDGLRYAVDILTDKKSGLVNLEKALFLTRKFGWMYGSRNSSVQERAYVVEEIYQKLLEYSNYQSNVVLGLASFEIQRIERMEFDGAVSTYDVMNLLGRSFRQTGHIEMVRQMAVLSAHLAWLRKKINPLGTGEVLPVASWGSWLISTSSKRAQLGVHHFCDLTRNRTLLEIFLYAAAKSMKDWRWLEDILAREDIMLLLGTESLDEMSRKQDEYAPERNRSIISLLRKAMREGDRQATALLGDIYERGIAGIDADLAKSVEVYGEGAMMEDGSATERLGTIAERLDNDACGLRPRILELLNEAEAGGNAKAASVLGNLYENGSGGVEVNLARAAELFGKAATRLNGLSADRLGNIARMEGDEARAIRPLVLDILRKAVEAQNREAASVLGRIYESGLVGLSPDLVQAVELYRVGLNRWDPDSADRLTKIALRDDGQARILRPHILKMLYDALAEDGNQYAASVLRDLCEGGMDIWNSYEERVMWLLSHRSGEYGVVGLLGKIATRDEVKSSGDMPVILGTLQEAAEAGNFEAASALGDIYGSKDIADAVETFGTVALQGHESSTSRLGKIALQSEGTFKARALQFLHEASDLEYIHAVAVQATVLEYNAEEGTGDISRAIELFAQAGLGGHEGSIIRLRNIAVKRRTDEEGDLAMGKLLDVAWRESCSEASETEGLAALGHILGRVDCPNSGDVEAALSLFEDASSRIYCHQYSTYHQLEVAFSTARGLASIVRNANISESMKEKAGSLLEEYVARQKEGPMEFFAAVLVNGSRASDETVPQAVKLYKEIIDLEGTCSSQQCVSQDGKAELLGEFEISSMKRVVSALETGAAGVPKDWELARQLQRRCETLEEKMREHCKYLDKIADVLEY